MNEVARLLLLVALAGTAITVLGGAAVWYMDEERRLRRALKHVLKGVPEATLFARGRGRAVGFHFASGQAAVAWDAGAWCLVYRIEELAGAELIVDGEVTARAFRGEARRALDRRAGAEREVTLRLIFDDPQHPDFELELWQAGDESLSPAKAVQEANRWLARAEAILRRPAAGAAPPPRVESQRPPPPEAEDEPPWDDDEEPLT